MSATSKPVLPETLPAAHALITQLQQQLQQAQWRVDQLEKQLYGPKSDQAPGTGNFSKEQVILDLFPAPAQPPATAEVVLPATSVEPKPKRPARHPQIKVLETVTERLEPAEKTCPHCGKTKCEIGCEKSERFEYVPAKVIRHEIIRPKLACPCGQGQVAIAPLPPTPIDKGMAGPGLLAYLVYAKFWMHLPLYRLQKEFERLGVYFARQTMCDWVEKSAEWLQPIYRLMKEHLLAGDYLQVDETPVRVLDPDVQGRCATGYLWVAGRPGADVIFEFYPGRGKEYAKQLLGNFKGYLQRDGYGVYGSLVQERPELIPCACLAHVRRKFIEAVESSPQEGAWFIQELRKLYLIEAHAREQGLSPEERHQLRNQVAPPIWKGLHERLQALQPTLLPQSPLGKAVRYMLGEWKPLQTYLADGRLEIDNNLTENAIRPSAVGKKNWLFIGHPEAGWRSAVIYSILVSCQRHGIDPWEYLKDVFVRLPAATNKDLPNFLPANWKAHQPPAA
jgi:transposase